MSNVTQHRTAAVNLDLRAQIAKLYWHHSIDLGDGIVTPGGKSMSICSHEAQLIFDRVDIAGRTVLDVGAWSGFFSFEAKRRGAARVLATDSYTWSHPHFRGREGFNIAKAALGIEVDAREIDVANLSTESVGQFDVVLYLGVFYHRYDAIEALARVASLTKHVLIVETHLDLRESSVPGMVFYPGHELNNDATNWWGPNELCMKELLLGHGFSEIEVAFHPAGLQRAIFHAWRSTDLRLKPLPEELRLKPYAEARQLEYANDHPVLSKLRTMLGPLGRAFWKI